MNDGISNTYTPNSTHAHTRANAVFIYSFNFSSLYKHGHDETVFIFPRFEEQSFVLYICILNHIKFIFLSLTKLFLSNEVVSGSINPTRVLNS